MSQELALTQTGNWAQGPAPACSSGPEMNCTWLSGAEPNHVVTLYLFKTYPAISLLSVITLCYYITLGCAVTWLAVTMETKYCSLTLKGCCIFKIFLGCILF